jgi:hypothetical protein
MARSVDPPGRRATPGREPFTADVCAASVQAHAQHEHGGGYGAHLIVRAGRDGERRQQVCQADVPAPHGAQTFEAFQEALTRAQRLQPTRGAQAIPRRYVTALDRLGRHSVGTV